VGNLQGFVEQFTYAGIFAVLLLGSLGLPVPEELSIITAAILSHAGVIRWWLAIPVCLLGVLSGDVVLYSIGRLSGRRVLSWKAMRHVLTPARARRLETAYRQHTMKTIVIARHLMGLRVAAFLTAGLTRVPVARFLVADGSAALVGVSLQFTLAYFFTDQVEALVADIHHLRRWGWLAALVVAAAIVVAAWWRSRQRFETETTL